MAVAIRLLREAADLSQAQLAEKAGVPVGSLRNYEQDRRIPRLDAAVRIARVLGVSLDELAANLGPDSSSSSGN